MSLQITNITDSRTQKPSKQLLETEIKNRQRKLDRSKLNVQQNAILKSIDKEIGKEGWDGEIKHPTKTILIDEELALEMAEGFLRKPTNPYINKLVGDAYKKNLNCIVIAINDKNLAELTLFDFGNYGIQPLCPFKQIMDFGSDNVNWRGLLNSNRIRFSKFTTEDPKKNAHEMCAIIASKKDIETISFLKANDEKVREKAKEMYISLPNYYTKGKSFSGSGYVDFQLYLTYMFVSQLAFSEVLSNGLQAFLDKFMEFEHTMILLKSIACSVSVVFNKMNIRANHQLLDFNSYLSEEHKRTTEKAEEERQKQWRMKQLAKDERDLALASGQYATGLFIGGVYAPSTNKYIGNGQQSIMSTNMGGYLNVGGFYMI